MKWLFILFLGVIMVPVFAQNSTNNQTDYQKFNDSIKILQSEHKTSDTLAFYYAMITFVAGTIIVTIIALGQSRQSKKIQTMTSEVQKVVKKQDELIADTQSVYAEAYVSWVQLIIKNFEYVVDWYNTRYLDQPISQIRENTRQNLIDHYERDLVYWCPKIETMELVKVFGKKIAYTVLSSTTAMHATDWQPDTDSGMAMMINEYKERIKQAIVLKNIFLPFCDNNTKIKDQKLKETYDKINTTD